LPLPDEAQRIELWRAVLPAATPVEPALDFEALAREFAMTGGHIKNAVLRGAYLEAHERRSISSHTSSGPPAPKSKRWEGRLRMNPRNRAGRWAMTAPWVTQGE